MYFPENVDVWKHSHSMSEVPWQYGDIYIDLKDRSLDRGGQNTPEATHRRE